VNEVADILTGKYDGVEATEMLNLGSLSKLKV